MTPPRLARWLLRMASPPALRDELAGELDAEFQECAVPSRGRMRAWIWYWGQALASLPRLLGRRASVARQSSSWLHDAGGDIRYAFRQVVRSPGSALTAIVTLALGIGATAAIFAVAYPVLLRPLPYGSPDHIVLLFELKSDGAQWAASIPDYEDWRTARSLSHVAGYSGGSVSYTVGGRTERLRVLAVTGEFLQVLGMAPAVGRNFTAGDMVPNAPGVVMLTHQTWQRRFGGTPVVGSHLTINGGPTEIIGVLPEQFEFPLRGDGEMLVPFVPNDSLRQRRFSHALDTIARLAPGASLQSARAELAGIGARIARDDPRFHSGSTVTAVPIADEMIGTFDRLFAALGLAASLVLLMACANVAMLLTLRMRSRAREMGVRAALGASRRRLVRQVFAEALLLALTSGALALIIARWTVSLATQAIPARQAMRMPGFREMGLSGEVLAFVCLVVGVVAMALTFVAGWRNVRGLSQDSLREDIRTSTNALARRRATAYFVSAQIALAMTVLAGAALLVQSVRRIGDVSPGFEVQNLLTFRLALPSDLYPSNEAVLAAHERFLERFAGIPGVTSAGSITDLPLTGRANSRTVSILGREKASGEPQAAIRTVSHGYFRAMGIPLIAGRELSAADTATSTPSVLVNRTLADMLFGGRAVGERVRFPINNTVWQIVGIVGDERFEDLDRPVTPAIYFAPQQLPSRSFSVVLRTAIDPASIADDVAATVGAINRGVPVFEIMTMEQLRAATRAVWIRQYVLWLVSAFAIVGLVLSAIGVYGVVGQGVADRRREFGIRMALGSTPGQVMALVLRQGAIPVSIGLAAGIAGAFVMRGQIEAFLFQSHASDAGVVAAAAAVLAVLALAACLLPSRRAAKIDPAVTLRG